MKRLAQPPPLSSYVLQVQVPRTTSTREITALETAMHGLALDATHPVALELAATATTRLFLLRATTPVALQHLAAQIRARYPQAEMLPLPQDPLRLEAHETVTAVELCPGAASYLPLRSWKERDLLQEGTDPLLGILAAFTTLPPHMRAVAQLTLLPAPATWSQAARRKAVEHPLEQERWQQRYHQMSGASSAPGAAQLVGLGLLVALLLLWLRFAHWLSRILPVWLLQAGTQLVHGRTPHLTGSQISMVMIGGAVIGIMFLLGLWLLQHIRSGFGQASLYDMRQVQEKTARMTYRVRLRLLVIAADEGRGCGHPSSLDQRPALLSLWHLLLPVPRPQEMNWPSLMAVYRSGRQETARQHRRRQERLDVLHALAAAYKQYHTASGGYFVPHVLSQTKTTRLLTHQTGFIASHFAGWHADIRRSRHLLSVADVAALWHLPQAHDLIDLPFVERGRARTLLVPTELASGHGWKIGQSTHAGQSLPVYLPGDCLRHNILTIASTGKGKSTLFQHLAQAALTGGDTAVDGLVVIEPHGDLIATLTGLLPRTRHDDVVVVDLANTAYPVGLNPLDVTLGRERDKAVDNLITIFEHLWANSYGSRTENILEYALKTLADANEQIVQADLQQGPDRQYTLLDVVPLLRRTSFRHAVLEQVRDALLTDWWQTYYEPLDLRLQSEVTSSVITKLSKFASSRVARRILGQPRSSIDLSQLVQQGHILLVSTASGVVGTDISALIGATLLGLLQNTLAEQARFAQEQRRHFLVLIDEFQVFGGVNYATMLAELRKYGGSFGLATQSLTYLDRFDRTLRPTVLANVDSIFAFDMAGEDARFLHELDGIEVNDITNLDDFQCYAKLSVYGRRLPVFSMRLDAPVQPDEEQSQHLRQRSQQRDARPAGLVDDMLRDAQVRQRNAAPTERTRGEQKGNSRQKGRTLAVQVPTNGEEVSSTATSRRKKKRGGGNKQDERTEENTSSPPPAPPHQHMMYEDTDTSEDREQGDHDAEA